MEPVGVKVTETSWALKLFGEPTRVKRNVSLTGAVAGLNCNRKSLVFPVRLPTGVKPNKIVSDAAK